MVKYVRNTVNRGEILAGIESAINKGLKAGFFNGAESVELRTDFDKEKPELLAVVTLNFHMAERGGVFQPPKNYVGEEPVGPGAPFDEHASKVHG